MEHYQRDFIAEIGAAAIEDMMETRVLASITTAQAILESNWGKSAPGNNLFGVKSRSGTKQTTQEEINGRMVTIVAGFAVYSSWLDSIDGHSTFLTVNGRYAKAGFFRACDTLDFIGAAKALQAAGYATDSKYADKLISIITTNKLFLLDKEAYQNMKVIEQLQARVAELEKKQIQITVSNVPIPDWAQSSVQKAVDNKIIAGPMPVTGSFDFFRLLTVMNNAGLLDKN